MAIPDPGAVTSTLAVPAGDLVQDVNVGVNIAHPFDSDLRIELFSPADKVVNLAEGGGTWGHDFSGTVFDDEATSSIISNLPPFTGHFRPYEPLSSLQGFAVGGTWKLRVVDMRGRYAGQLESWTLQLTACDAVQPSPPTVGAPDPPPLPTGVPSGQVPNEGTPVTVTTDSDDANGDVSSVSNLQANPGPDGISLREAILATNNDPGTYTVRFTQSLSGSTIQVGSSDGNPLPALLGGGVLIDGDINGDGQPDVTIDGQQVVQGGRCGICGLAVISGGNRLHALTLKHFSTGVFFAPASPYTGDPTLPSHQTFGGNVLSGLVLADISGGPSTPTGIWIAPTPGHSECAPTACQTYNRWVDTRIVGNSIGSSRDGIEAQLALTVGDALDRTTVAGNVIRIGVPGSTTNQFGVNLAAGGGGGANENRISDALVAYNSIEAGGHAYAINVFAGWKGGSANLVEDLRIVANHVHFSGVPAIRAAARAVVFAISDDCSGGPGVGCSRENVVRRVQIVGNVLEGQDNAGVLAADPCCGGTTDSSLTDLRIADNLVEGIVPPHELNPWGIEIGGNNNVSNVTIDSNTIDQQTTDPSTAHAAYLAGGGIAVLGGLGAGGGSSIRDVSVTNNRVDTDLVGIALVGGGPSDEDAANDTSGHSVSGIDLRGNVIGRVPVLATRWDSKVKGINVIGGLGGTPPATGHWTKTTGNSVTSVTLENNLVAGVVDDVSVHSNFGAGASGNVGALGLRPPTLVISKGGSGRGTVTSDPTGIDCGSACSHEFDDRSQVTLTATAATGSTFKGWSGDCSGTSTCTLTMGAADSATATFDRLCIVPKVKGKKLAAAKRAIRKAHCSVGKVSRAYSTRVKRGRVISQKPAPGKKLPAGSKVKLKVSKGPR